MLPLVYVLPPIDPVIRPWCSCCLPEPYWMWQDLVALRVRAIQRGYFKVNK